MRFAVVGLLVTIASWPGTALACAVCQDPNDPRSGAYVNMTVFMSLTPLLAVGGVIFWLYRRFAAVEALTG